MEEFSFEEEVPENTWEDLVCENTLSMNIKLIKQEYGIQCIFVHILTNISITSEGIEGREIDLKNISREFHLKKSEKDTDDIEYINTHDDTIDLSRVIEQELLIAGL